MAISRFVLLSSLLAVGCADFNDPACGRSTPDKGSSRAATDEAKPSTSGPVAKRTQPPPQERRPLPLPASLLAALRTFRQHGCTRSEYEALDRVLTAELERNPRAATILGFYASCCARELEDRPRAVALAAAVLENDHSANYVEAYEWKGVVESWIREEEERPIAEDDGELQIDSIGRHYEAMWRLERDLARLEPSGIHADMILNTVERDDNGTEKWPDRRMVHGWLDRWPRRDPTALGMAAELYIDMKDDRAAIDCYGLVVSHHWSRSRFSHFTADIHAGRARAHERLGEWDRAIDHAVRSMASGGWAEPCLRRAEAAWAEGRTVVPPESQHDPEKLDQVARLFGSAQLYPRAIAAAEHAGRLRGSANRALLEQLWSEYLEMLETCRKEYGGMAVVRGTPLTNAPINRAREQVERWSNR